MCRDVASVLVLLRFCRNQFTDFQRLLHRYYKSVIFYRPQIVDHYRANTDKQVFIAEWIVSLYFMLRSKDTVDYSFMEFFKLSKLERLNLVQSCIIASSWI